MQNNTQTSATQNDDQKSYVASDTSFTPDNSARANKPSSKFSNQVKQAKKAKSQCDDFTIEEEWEIGIDSPCRKN